MNKLIQWVVVAGCAVPALAETGSKSSSFAKLKVADRVDLREAALAQPEEGEEAPVDFSQQGLWDGWSGDVFFGLTGSDGNTQRINFRLGASADKETTHWNFTNNFVYANSQDDGEESEDRLRVNGRQERKFQDSPWSAFTQEQYTYDEFDSFLHRLELQGGAGYQFIDEEKLKVKGLGGAGGRWQDGNGSEPGWVPEVFLGGEYEQALTQKQKLTVDSTVFIQLDEVEARWVTNAAWEVLVDEEANLSLRAGIRNEYDSAAEGDTRKNDIEFFVLLSFSY